MKKTIMPFVLVLAGFAAFSCDNLYVQEILRDGVYLKNIALAAENGNGIQAEVNFGLNPAFTPEVTSYFAFVPKDSERITITGVTNHEQTVTYSMNGGPPQNNGTFSFSSVDPVTEKNSTVTLTVERKHMDTIVYTVMVYRKQPVWLTAINVKTDAGGESLSGLTPGFNASITDYSVGVSRNTRKFKVRAVKRDYDNEHIGVEYSGDGVIDGLPDGEGYYSYEFPEGVQEKTVAITASYPQEDLSPVVYRLTIRRSRQVIPDPAWESCFSISGSADHHFYEGEPVSFRVTPPFGHIIQGVTAVTAGGTELTLAPALPQSDPAAKYGNTYGFIMPGEGVTLRGIWAPIKSSTELTVRYVGKEARPIMKTRTRITRFPETA
jgi:hypothetical protein